MAIIQPMATIVHETVGYLWKSVAAANAYTPDWVAMVSKRWAGSPQRQAASIGKRESAHKMSLRSAPSRRTSAALQSWLLDRRQQQSRALRNRSNAHQRPVGERIIRVRLKRPQREPHD